MMWLLIAVVVWALLLAVFLRFLRGASREVTLRPPGRTPLTPDTRADDDSGTAA